MLSHAIFRQLGAFTHPGLLTPDQCRAWRLRAAKAESRPARIHRDGTAVEDDGIRRTQQVQMGLEDKARLDAQISAVGPDLERHFNMALGPLRECKCLVYGPGDFFVPHYDVDEVDHKATTDLQRRIATVLIVLNAPDDHEAPYQGGDLTFYGLLDVPDSDEIGLTLAPDPGMLIAFKPNVLHGISPILFGNRYVIVGWFHDQS